MGLNSDFQLIFSRILTVLVHFHRSHSICANSRQLFREIKLIEPTVATLHTQQDLTVSRQLVMLQHLYG